MSTDEIAPCPCGQTPGRLCIVEQIGKYALVVGDCCGDWHVEFDTQNKPRRSPEIDALALSAWNAAPRARQLQRSQ